MKSLHESLAYSHTIITNTVNPCIQLLALLLCTLTDFYEIPVGVGMASDNGRQYACRSMHAPSQQKCPLCPASTDHKAFYCHHQYQ